MMQVSVRELVCFWLLLINAAAFVLCGIDKRRARRGKWRISERTLLMSAVLGGSAGLMLGMRCFHHKTRHRRFTIGVPLILCVQMGLAAFWLLRR